MAEVVVVGEVQERGEREGHLVAWAVGEARRLRLLGLRIPRVLAEGPAALTGSDDAVAGLPAEDGGVEGAPAAG